MTAYRDPDRADLAIFAKHLEIASALLEVNAELAARLRNEADPELRQAYRQGWVDLWTQLAQARAIVASLGRATARFEHFRRIAGDPYRVAAGARPITRHMREATALAIRELCACVPEVVVQGSERRRPTAARPRLFDASTEVLLWRVGFLLAIFLAACVVCATIE